MLRIIPGPLAVALTATLLLCACSDDASSPADNPDAATLSDTAQPDASQDTDTVSSACANNLSGDADDPVVTNINGWKVGIDAQTGRSEEHTSELQSRPHLVCRLLLEKKKTVNPGPHQASAQQHDVLCSPSLTMCPCYD